MLTWSHDHIMAHTHNSLDIVSDIKAAFVPVVVMTPVCDLTLLSFTFVYMLDVFLSRQDEVPPC